MTQPTLRLALLGAALAGCGPMGLAQVNPAQVDSKAAGHWQGTIQIPEHELGITVDIARSAAGVWIGSMTVLRSSAVDVPLTGLTVEDKAVRFAASLPDSAAFDGHLSADGSTLSGKASNAAGEAPFQLSRSGEAQVKVPPPSSVLTKEFEGSWEGSIDVGGKVSRVNMKIAAADDGTATATLTVIDKSTVQIPVTTITLKGKELQLEARAVSGAYRGSLDANQITGEWSEGATHVPLIFKRAISETKPEAKREAKP